jgi:hypothetical protein
VHKNGDLRDFPDLNMLPGCFYVDDAVHVPML